jgi:hypothetical protein
VIEATWRFPASLAQNSSAKIKFPLSQNSPLAEEETAEEPGTRGRRLLMTWMLFVRHLISLRQKRKFTMRNLLNKLIRSFRSTKPAHTTRRASLRVECLEDRLVPTTVSLNGPVLTINNIAPNHTIVLQSTGFVNGFRGLKVFDNNVLVDNPAAVNISNINTVNIFGNSDTVIVDDSNGMPFAQGAHINLNGVGASSLILDGSRGVAGDETYVAGGASFTPGEIFLDNLTFQLGSSVTSVTDFIKISGVLDVQTSGTNVSLFGANGVTQTLTGMGFGGGDILTYAFKDVVKLEEFAPNAVVNLFATRFDAVNPSGINQGTDLVFQVNMHAANDQTVIAATPANVFTEVNSIVAPVANPASVVLQANAGPVIVEGNSSTSMSIGRTLGNGEALTNGIRANVTVIGVGSLLVNNSANVTTAENVTITPSQISGTGLFGNNNAKVFYGSIGAGGITIFTGQLAEQFTVTGNDFSTPISIVSDSHVSFRADVFVDPNSSLNLFLFANATPKNKTRLAIHPTDVKVKISGTPDGTADVFSNGVRTSEITYHGIGKVTD